MKFYNAGDESIYEQERKFLGVDEVEFIKKRRHLSIGLKDRKKSKETEKSWRKNRFKIMKGISKFHKSTKGKRFHRDLGRFLATRDLKGLSYLECEEGMVPITSCLTHAYYELNWYMSLQEEVDYRLFLDELYSEAVNALHKLKNLESDLSEHSEFLYRVCETSSLISSFATKFEKTVEEVEKLWKKAKEVVKSEYSLSEEDDNFYSLVVGVLKKMLGSNRPKLISN